MAKQCGNKKQGTQPGTKLNGICPACKRYQEGECPGTANPIWTGCIYRKIKK